MPWRPLPRIAFAVAIYSFQPAAPADLPLELGDELYIIEEGGQHGDWYRGYLVAPPSLLAGLTSVKGQTLEARVFSGIFPRCCVEVREELGRDLSQRNSPVHGEEPPGSDDGTHIKQANGEMKGSAGLQTADLSTSKNKSFLPDTRYSGAFGLTFKASPSSKKVSHQSALPPTPVSPEKTKHVATGRPPAPVPMLKIGDETPTSTAEPLVDEIASCLREWHSTNLHELLLHRRYAKLEKMSAIVSRLDYARRQLLNDVLTAQERLALREQTVWNLVRGNKMLSGEVIVRDSSRCGRLLTGEDSAIELTKLQSVMSLLDANPTIPTETRALHHLLVEVKSIQGWDAESIVLHISLCHISSDATLVPVSEIFSIGVSSTDTFDHLARSNKLKTLFTDLSGRDIGESASTDGPELYLVVKVLINEMPRALPMRPEAEPLSRGGTLKDRSSDGSSTAAQDTLKRGRGSLMFGSKRKPGVERVKPLNQSGRMTPQVEERAPTPISKDEPPSEEKPTPKAKPKPQPMARVVGIGALKVGQLTQSGQEETCLLNIWSPASTEDDAEGRLADPGAEIRNLLHSSSGKYVRSSRASQVDLHLTPFLATNAETLVRTNPTSMHLVHQSQKLAFSEAPTRPRSDIYITFSRPAIMKGSHLAHPELGLAPIHHAGMLNLQLTIEVRDAAGRRIEKCIHSSSNDPAVTAWRTPAAELGSSWNHTICLRLPAEQVSGAHLIMSVADAPDFPFALAWMPLWDKEAFTRDGAHSLIMHAYDRSTSSVVNGRGAYLSLPWNTDDENFSVGHDGIAAPVATLELRSQLCSTEFSQNQVIISLINWKQQSSKRLMEILQQVVFVPEIEIVKQLKDVLDSLFAILVHKAGDTKYEDQIFIDIVTVLGMVNDRRFNLGPLVEQYTETHFHFPLAAVSMIRSFTRLLQSVADPASSRTLRALFKVGQQIVRLIVTSHRQQQPNSVSTGMLKTHASFREDMQAVFFGLQMMMRSDTAALVGNKTLLVQHWHSWLPELLPAFDKEEVIRIAVNFVEATSDVRGKLVLHKLVLVLNYCQLDELWSEQRDRQLLIQNCIRWLSPYWVAPDEPSEQWQEQVRLCCSVVSQLLVHPVPSLYDFMPEMVATYRTIVARPVKQKSALTLLFPQSYPFTSKPVIEPATFDEALLELSALMASISGLIPPQSTSIPEDEMATYILSVLDVQKSLLDCEAYPQTWLSLNVHQHRSAMRTLEHVFRLLLQSFLPTPDYAEQFSMELWKAFFMTLLKLVGSETLALETFPEQKRRVVWKIAGDVRESGADLLRRSWESIGWESNADDQRRYNLNRLGGYQVQYVPGLIAPLMDLCLSVHEGLRCVAVEILQTMIVSEWALSEDLGLMETEMIASLDLAFKTKPVTESIAQKLFLGELLDLFEPIASQPDDALWVALKELVTTIDELMDLLVAAHGDSVESSLHTLRLMDFMKDMQKEDLFVRYVHDLARQQDTAHNSTEAGLALQLHADLYTFDSGRVLPAVAGYPEQSMFDRKESLYFQMIQHFEDGRTWHLALHCYRELAHEYEHMTFDYAKLARTQRSMGKIHEAIAQNEGPTSRYFRVFYRGLGFPPSLRGKQFIFAGSPNERMAAFTDRLQKTHPSAQISQATDSGNMEGQFLEVSGVSPYRDLDHPVYQRARLAPSVRDYLLTSRPSQFTSTLKRESDGDNKALETRVHKVVYTTAGFPSILRQCEILSTDTVELSPIDVAIERTWRKTADLQGLEKRAALGEDPSNSALTSALLQLLDVDQRTSTSPALYRQFLPPPHHKRVSDVEDSDGTNDHDQQHQSQGPRETALYVALSDHAAVMKRCLMLYTRPALQATRKDLNARFDAVYPEEARLPTPPSRGQDVDSTHSLDFDDIPPDSRHAYHDIVTNGHVVSSDPASRRAKPDKPGRMSLHFLKGGAAGLIPARGYTKVAETHPSPPDRPTFTHPESTFHPQQENIHPHPPRADSAVPLTTHQTSQSTPQALPEPFPDFAHNHDLPNSVYQASSTGDIDGGTRTPAPLDNDDFGKNLTSSLGAGINMDRFDHGRDPDEGPRPVTRESQTTTSTGVASKKRFSLMGMGMLGRKKSGGALGALSST